MCFGGAGYSAVKPNILNAPLSKILKGFGTAVNFLSPLKLKSNILISYSPKVRVCKYFFPFVNF